MHSNWFDFDDDISSDFFDKSKIKYLKKNFGIRSKKLESQMDNRTSGELNDILDLATSRSETRGKRKLLDALLKDKLTGRNTIGRVSRFSEEPIRMRHADAEDFLSDVEERVSRIRSQFLSERSESESSRKCNRKEKREKRFDMKSNFMEKSPSCTSANSYGFADVTNEMSNRCRKDSINSNWSKKSCPENVTFPTSSASTLSEESNAFSEKTIGRSISRDSDDSVCTEKSVDCSTVSEKLPDGTDKTQIESNESWLRKSTSGSKIAEKKVNDLTMKERNDDGTCEKSTTRMSYLEKSATGSSLQEEMTSEKMTSSSKGGTKTVEQKTSETYKKSHKSTPNKSSYYDDLDSCSFDHFVPSSFRKFSSDERIKTSTPHLKDYFCSSRTPLVSEKISKLIDEAVQQDDLFKIPSALQTDLDKMTDDFFNSKPFGRDRKRTGERLAGFSKAEKNESYLTSSKLIELKSENESLQQENLKLQSIIQDVTAVNKRWQKYNNERRLYVQKLLLTIQDLQEQINLISEKSAFQSKTQEEIGSRHDEIERLKKEHQEHVTVLELQIKSHKDDWDAERKEKRKALKEKEDLENKVQELTKDVKFLKDVLQEERQRKNIICTMCKNKYEEKSIFQRTDFRPPMVPLNASNCPNGNFCSAVHGPYDSAEYSSEECFCAKENVLESGDLCSQEPKPFYVNSRTELNDSTSKNRFSRTSKSKKILSGDTIVVEGENGIRLSITEQFPSKDSNLKSILKKNDKKIQSSIISYSNQTEPKDELKSCRNRVTCNDKPHITCEEFSSANSPTFGVSIGFQEGGLAQVTSFSPITNSGNYLSAKSSLLLNVEPQSSRSKSEPNTRSNSSENLKPLRESSSWNNESFGVDTNTTESVICPGCDRVFPPTMHLQFLDHFEICQSENNHF